MISRQQRQQILGQNERRKRRRDGWTMIAVLVCLSIAMAITAAGMRTSLRARRQLNNQWQLEQTRWLLDAGIRRTQRLAAEQPDYEGESWVLDEALDSYASARVEINVVKSDSYVANEVKQFEIVSIIRNRDDVPVQTKRSRVVSVSVLTDSEDTNEPKEPEPKS